MGSISCWVQDKYFNIAFAIVERAITILGSIQKNKPRFNVQTHTKMRVKSDNFCYRKF